jgi:hypothetical protein
MFASVRRWARKSPPRTLKVNRGMAMTWKDEVLVFWILCTVVIAIVLRHFGGAVHLVEQMAAFNAAYMPGLVHVMVRRLG